MRKSHRASVVNELGCEYGFRFDQLRQRSFDSIGIDISETAILKAREKNPSSNFKVRNYNDFEFYSSSNPDIIIMAQLTWYVINSLDLCLEQLKAFATREGNPIF